MTWPATCHKNKGSVIISNIELGATVVKALADTLVVMNRVNTEFRSKNKR